MADEVLALSALQAALTKALGRLVTAKEESSRAHALANSASCEVSNARAEYERAKKALDEHLSKVAA